MTTAFFAASHGWWETTLEALRELAGGDGVPVETAMQDLRHHQDLSLRPTDPQRFPSLRQLADRWGWSTKRVRTLLRRHDEWGDPRKAEAWELWLEARRRRQVGAARGAPEAEGARHGHAPGTGGARHRQGEPGEPGERGTHGAREGHARGTGGARAGHGGGHRRVGTPTPHPHPTRGSSSDHPLSADASGGGSDPWAEALALWAEVSEPSARAITSRSKGLGKDVADAIRRQGAETVLLRLRWAARAPDGRDWGANMPSMLRERRDLRTYLRTKNAGQYDVWAQVWHQAGEPTETPEEQRTRSTDGRVVDLPLRRAEDAWKALCAVPSWRRPVRDQPPARAEDDGRWHLAEDWAEHQRRREAMAAAGGWNGWATADQRGRTAFAWNFRDAYAAALRGNEGGAAAEGGTR